MHQQEYAASLARAEVVIIAGVDNPGKIPEAVAASLRGRGRDAHFIERVDDIVAHVAGDALSGDVLLVMSNGSFGGIHEKLLETLRGRAARPAMPDSAG